jgi:hypothetical protein
VRGLKGARGRGLLFLARALRRHLPRHGGADDARSDQDIPNHDGRRVQAVLATRRGVARQNKGDFSVITFLFVLIGAGVVIGLAVFAYLRWLGPSDPPTDMLG